MKRLMLLLTLLLTLLCLLALPALAEAPDPAHEAAVQALGAELLPECAILWGDVRPEEDDLPETAAFLVETTDGPVLVGAQRDGLKWALTRSTPLPEGTVIEYHSHAHAVNVQIPRPELDQPGEPYWATYTVNAEADGSWRITAFRDDRGAVYVLNEAYISSGEDMSILSGTLNCPLDMTEADWLSLPAAWEEAVAMVTPAEDGFPAAVEGLFGWPVCACVQDETTAFVALDEGEDVPHRLLVFEKQEDGVWVLTLESETALLPQYRTRNANGTSYRYQVHKGLTLTLDGENLTASYDSLGYMTENYIFRQTDGAWRFARHEEIDQGNRMRFDLDYADGVAVQSRADTDDGFTETTPPCPMPWLEEAALLAAFDASAFPTNLWELGDEDLARVAEILLPEYEYLGGKFWVNAASFLMYNEAGELVFLGGTYADGAWKWTESNPLPADTYYDDYHSGGDSFIISFDYPGEVYDRWGEEVFVECVIALQEDGRWQVTQLFNSSYEWMFFDDVTPGLYITLTGMVYGECTLERDITKIDWSAFPLSLEAVLPYMSRDWGVIGVDSLPLYADAAGTALLADYLYSTPVHILERADGTGTSGGMARVQIADSDVTGWLDESGLLLGGDQLWEKTVVDEDGEWSYLTTAEEDAGWVVLPGGAELYAASNGEVLYTEDYGVWFQLMADCGNGWYHVGFGESMESFYVRAEDCLPVE